MHESSEMQVVFVMAMAIVLVIGSFAIVGLRRPRFQGYREIRLPLVNSTLCAAVSVGALNLLTFLYVGDSSKALSYLAQAFWIATVALSILHSKMAPPVRVLSAAILFGFPFAVLLHAGDANSMLRAVDEFYGLRAEAAADESSGLRPSHGLLTVHYFVSFFFVANYYGNVLRIRNVRLAKLGESSAFTAEAVNNTVAIGSALFAVLAALLFVGVDLKVLSVLTAIVTAGVAAIFKDLLTNTAAGILLILHGDINQGDVLEIEDLGVGVVQKITLRHTVIADRNEISVLVPNVVLFKNKIRHFTYNGKQTRLTADIGVGYDADLDKAIATMKSVCFHVNRVLADPPPTVQIRSTNDYDITLRLCFWVDTLERGVGNVKSEVMYYLITEFAEQGIIIPYPVVELRSSGKLAVTP